MSDACVLDASAVLVLIGGETGAEIVKEAIRNGAVISSVNLCEVVAKLIEVGLSPDEVRRVVGGVGLDVRDFDSHQAYETGFLRRETKDLGLSLGDRACLALAADLGSPAMTADRAWLKAGLPVEVRVVR